MITIPPYDVPAIDTQTGRVNPTWYDFFRALTRMKITDLSDVSTTAPADGEVLIWNDTDGVYEPGAN